MDSQLKSKSPITKKKINDKIYKVALNLSHVLVVIDCLESLKCIVSALLKDNFSDWLHEFEDIKIQK